MSTLVLVTGGTGKTGRRLASQLRAKGIPHRIASRTPKSDECHFDWDQPRTWDPALANVSAAYLVAPSAASDTATTMIKFIQRAIERGVSRFVLLSASLLPAGGPAMGQVHFWLQQNASQWTVLRPSWFMQNFSEGQHLASIRDENAIYSAAEDGRVPFISADDIAEAALTALTRDTALNADFVLTGGELLTYDDVADRIGKVVGRMISHRRLSTSELAARYRLLGLAPIHAQGLAVMDAAIAAGAENRLTSGVQQLTGNSPITFDAFLKASGLDA